MSFNLIEIWNKMGPFAIAIVVTLLVMAMASMAVFVERVWVYFRSRRVSRRFAAQASALLSKRSHDAFIKAADTHKSSHLAGLLAGGMKTYLAARNEPGELGAVELARRDMDRRAEAISADVRRGMSVLASVGSVAPFVGLLGTVVGIIGACQGIAAEGSGGLGAVSAGIAEALIVTALGLVVAIPSVLAFNFLSTKADRLLLALEQSRGEFVDYLENLPAHVITPRGDGQRAEGRASAAA
jgi:biopolymer transport protein ExbB